MNEPNNALDPENVFGLNNNEIKSNDENMDVAIIDEPIEKTEKINEVVEETKTIEKEDSNNNTSQLKEEPQEINVPYYTGYTGEKSIASPYEEKAEDINRNKILKALAVLFFIVAIVFLISYFSKNYIVYFDNNDGTNGQLKMAQVKKLEDLELYTPTRKGYIFDGWIISDNKISKEMTLRASWIELKEEENNDNPIVTLTVTFDTDGGSSIEPQTVNYNEKMIVPKTPTKDGYTFKEWTYNGETYNFDNAITSNITLKATYTKNETAKPVEQKPTVTITLSRSSASMKVGETITINANVRSLNNSNVSDNVTWSSSNTGVATVDSNGKVTAKKGGTAKITAKAGGASASATITVISYKYEIVDVPGSTTGQCYIYVETSDNKKVSGTVTVKYMNGASETINVPASGYLWPSRNVIASITNVKGN